jgi:transcriptional regulator with PAS, ATPase and Fis domain
MKTVFQILAKEHCITLADLPENLVAARSLSSAASDQDDPRRLDSVERRHVLAVLQQEKGNKAAAAKALGISQRALYRLLEKYQLST